MAVRFLSAGLAGAVLAMGSASADSADDISAAGAAFVTTFNAGDASALADHFSTDAMALSPGWVTVTGNERIADMYGAFFEAGFYGLETTTDNLEVVDDNTAFEVITEVSHRDNDQGGVESHHFKALRVWRKDDDGTWRVHRISFNRRPES